ncbi:MAG: 4Fe-4S binding protein [Planctomycetaceae bacterium]|nr:4Fe-4S binding protein [Planctomycetaceae bacterium]
MSIVKKNSIQTFFARIVPHRLWVQAAFLLVWLDPLAIRMHTVCGPVFHCYACPLATFACPIGVIAQFGALHLIPFMAIGTLVLVGALLGSLICGWVCPFGFLQDLAARVPTPRLTIPRWMGWGRYVVLLGTVVAIPLFFGEGHALFICRICPAGGIEKAVPDMVAAGITGQPIPWVNPIKGAIIVAFVASIFFTIRPWCRVLCPLGAIFAFFNRFSVFSMQLNEGHCTKCGRCSTLCSYGVEPHLDPNGLNCIRCLECTKCGPGALQSGTVFNAESNPQAKPQTTVQP